MPLFSGTGESPAKRISAAAYAASQKLDEPAEDLEK